MVDKKRIKPVDELKLRVGHRETGRAERGYKGHERR